MTVGEKIKQRRIELNMSQEELAKRCGYKSRSSINKIELSRDLPLKKVEQMAHALDLSIAYLMGWEESPSLMAKSLEKTLSQNPSSTTANFLYDGIKHGDVVESITDSECDLIRAYRTATPEQQRKIVEMIAFIKSIKAD